MTLRIQELPSEHFDARHDDGYVDTIIIHSMHDPDPDSDDPFAVHNCMACLNKNKVSAHYIIDPEGQIYRCVNEDKQAWHAGISRMPGEDDLRESVNSFSIGIELIGDDVRPFSDDQYIALVALTKEIVNRHQIKNIYGHADISPGRKTDPWGFDWQHYLEQLGSIASKINSPLSKEA